jgi:hypothetical protein
MGDIICSGQKMSPMLRMVHVYSSEIIVIHIEGMVILALRIKNLSESAPAANSLHFSVEYHLRIVFRKEIY